MNRIRYAALLDSESSGLETTDVTIEIAVTLFDVSFGQPVASFASLIQGNRNEAHAINGIPPELLTNARPADEVWRAVKWTMGPADVIVAHHANHDKKFCPDLGKPWICSENDLVWPQNAHKGGRGGSLAHLALGIGLGVASAHRAMTDVDTMSRIFTRLKEMGHDIEAMLLHGMRPKGVFHSLASYEQKDIVKQAGFRWDPEKKLWWREMPIEDAEKLPFKTQMVVT